MTFGGGLGWMSAPVVGLFALAVMGLASFVRIERNAENLLIDFAIFRQRALLTSLTTLVLTHVIHFPIALCAPLYLQSVLGTSVVAAGFVFALLPLSTALSIPLSGPLADRFKASIVASSGIVMIVAGIACLLFQTRYRFGSDCRGRGAGPGWSWARCFHTRQPEDRAVCLSESRGLRRPCGDA